MTTKLPRKIDPKLAHLYDENGVFYPETDGMPLPDGFYQEGYYINAVSSLRGYFKDQPRVAVSGNTFIYYRQGFPRQFVSPDCYVAFDVDVDHILLPQHLPRLGDGQNTRFCPGNRLSKYRSV